MTRSVATALDATVEKSSDVALQVAVAPSPGLTVRDGLVVTLDGRPLPVTETRTHTGTRMHLLRAPAGRLSIRYEATVTGRADPVPVTAAEVWEYLRPSRFVESDRFNDVAGELFGGVGDPARLLSAVSSWVGGALSYVPGSSGPMDGAGQTMDLGAGVCRDYAHLVAAMLRARGMAARVVAVYAPGCAPMDFHAVVEADLGGRWQVLDATLLAPRQTLVRIATGRDAADTAFMSSNGGSVVLDRSEVFAVVDGELPVDDLDSLVPLR
ncbi:transglutaminase-like domain-containing protein [Nakamurella deserti]|uniref:transglutaminase domain-containing protein n=1 Tax=Nakamurella deserti TaxID=2164074 RepID=UPI000DBE55BD